MELYIIHDLTDSHRSNVPLINFWLIQKLNMTSNLKLMTF